MRRDDIENSLKQAREEEMRGNYDKAEQLVEHSLSVINSSEADVNDQRDIALLKANALKHRGIIKSARGDENGAIVYLNESLTISEAHDDKMKMSEALGQLGIVYRHMSELPKALEHLNKALHLQEELGYTSGAAISIGNIANVYMDLSDYTIALDLFTQALHIHEELGVKYGIAMNLGSIGILHRKTAEYHKAHEFMFKALSIFEELDSKSGLATTLGNIGKVYQELSEYNKAIEFQTRALEIDTEIANKSGIARHLDNIGNNYWHISEYTKAFEFLSRAIQIHEELGNRRGIAYNLSGLGLLYHGLLDSSKALDYLHMSLKITEEIGDKSSASATLGNLGNVYAELKDYPAALEYLTKALHVCESLANKSGVAINLGNLGVLYMYMSDYPRALEHLERAHLMHSELGQRKEAAGWLADLAVLYAEPGNPNRDDAQAEEYINNSIAIDKTLGIKNYKKYKILADICKQQGRWSECVEHIYTSNTLQAEMLSEESKKAASQIEQRRLLAEREKEIAIAKAATDAQMSATTTLLYKVLPETVATRMICGEQEIADYYPQVSILFADIAGFTPLSADMPAIIVVRFLNFVFAEFDRIIKKHGCEKIKTIGDGYMAVCGAPLECSDHAERLAAAALEMQETIVLPESIREHLPDNTKLGIRIGLHTGSVVAGVIGQERFVYDIYSDAVNIAARMESHGVEDKIHCSNDFYRHMQNRFAMTKNATHGLVFVKRGELEIKGKGKMKTYFLQSHDTQ